MSINDVRPELGLEPIEGGDEPLVNAMLAPLSQVVAEPEPPPSALAPFAGQNNPPKPKPNDNEPDEVPGANEDGDERKGNKLAAMVLEKLKARLNIHA
jgi:hypothetical protein